MPDRVSFPSLVLLFLFLGACGRPVLLQPGARDVLLVSAPPSDLDSYRELTTLTCYRGANARDPSTNIIWCQNDLRNRAHEAGGDLVLLTSQQLGTLDCANCVTLVATVFRRG